MSSTRRPLILGIGGTIRDGSSSEAALEVALAAARDAGATAVSITGRDLLLPIYDPSCRERSPQAVRLLNAVRQCDGMIISAPGYHGSMSGMLKNALDYLEDLRADERPYLDGMPVGCIAVAYGWQAAISTLQGLRVTVHALRGWPSPFGAAINSSATPISGGQSPDPEVCRQLSLVAEQVTGQAWVGGGVMGALL